MFFRISPLWWPFLVLFSPVVLFFLIKKNRKYISNKNIVENSNRERLDKAEHLELPELDFLEMTVIVEEKTKDGFTSDAGVSYLFKSNLGSLLFDVGFGDERPAFPHNVKKLNFDVNSVDAVAISHLHLDHMGGMEANRKKMVRIPGMKSNGKICYVPDNATSEQAKCKVVDSPTVLDAGIATTGPLGRSLFFFGLTEEQALIANVKGKGLVVITGCGHPTIELILKMTKKLSDIPVYAVGGGLHFPVTDGRGNRIGIKFQTIMGTGKPPWKKITRDDMNSTIETLNRIKPERILLSGHDSCDFALEEMVKRLNSDTDILKAGETYRF